MKCKWYKMSRPAFNPVVIFDNPRWTRLFSKSNHNFLSLPPLSAQYNCSIVSPGAEPPTTISFFIKMMRACTDSLYIKSSEDPFTLILCILSRVNADYSNLKFMIFCVRRSWHYFHDSAVRTLTASQRRTGWLPSFTYPSWLAQKLKMHRVLFRPRSSHPGRRA